jgi:hypothetical protein
MPQLSEITQFIFGQPLMLTTVIAGGIPIAQADPAVVVRSNGGCTLFDGNGAMVSGTSFKGTFTQSNNGNATVQCSGDVTPSSSGHAAHFDFASTGIHCFTDNPFSGAESTQNWEETVSASGNAKITCHFP